LIEKEEYYTIKRIREKIIEIETYGNELKEIIPTNFELYKTDLKTKAACERYFEKIIGTIIDISYQIIKYKNIKTQKREKLFIDLANNNFISKELAVKIMDAKGMRNVLAHEYGNIDDELVFYSITKELEKDVNEYLKAIRKIL